MPPEGLALAVEDLLLSGDGRGAPILAIPHLGLAGGAQAALVGPSGSGKTSLLFVLAGLTTPSRGRLRWGEDEPFRMGEAQRDAWRRRRIGLIFQKPQLVPELDILGNLMLKGQFGGGGIKREEALALIARLNLPHHGRRAALLSQGEQQRVALARALLYRPAILLADEPTASLDAENAALVSRLLREEAERLGATLVCATHDPLLMAAMPAIRLDQGRLAEGGP